MIAEAPTVRLPLALFAFGAVANQFNQEMPVVVTCQWQHRHTRSGSHAAVAVAQSGSTHTPVAHTRTRAHTYM